MSGISSNGVCSFCGATHNAPNEPGGCVIYWQRAHDQKAARLDKAGQENERFRIALEVIRDRLGKVCDQYDTCHHRACASSYTSWAIASQALEGRE